MLKCTNIVSAVSFSITFKTTFKINELHASKDSTDKTHNGRL